MSLGLEVLILALSMALGSALPFYSLTARRHSRSIFLIGTGALFGICFFDLVPDVFQMGGSKSLFVMAGVWLVYSIAHLAHLGHYHGDPSVDHSLHSHSRTGFVLFLASLVAHCFASGMLLTVSFGLSKKIASTVFVALVAHKIYESLLLSSMILGQKRSKMWRAGVIGIYAASLPAGALTTVLFQDSLNQQVAVLISSVAVGTLLGCLIFDFLIPSIGELREQRVRIAWIIAGLALTQIVMRQL